jgi:hypothetical protein
MVTSTNPRWVSAFLRLAAAPAWPWCLAFVIMSITVWHTGDMNAASRFATLRAMSTRQTFMINRYVAWGWTNDWARTPDGNYYSNKAPGPALLAFPVTWAMDRVLFARHPELRRTEPSRGYKTLVSVLFQVLPCAVVMLLASRALRRRGASLGAQSFAALAILFGNTASVYMNNYHGHGMTAWLLLALALALLLDSPTWAGCLYGLALLCDYAVGVLALPFLVGLVTRRESWGLRGRRALHLAAGAALPAALWSWYHTACFGSPFAIALSYQNPAFHGEGAPHTGLQAVWSLPQWDALWQLLFGHSQGLLFTQPWVLAAYSIAAVAALRRRAGEVPVSLTILLLGGLPLLIWSNAGFSGWHGGWSPGPRYLSAFMPLVGFYVALLYDRLAVRVRTLLWLTLIPAVVLRLLIFAAAPRNPHLSARAPIWDTFWDDVASNAFGAAGLRVLFLVSLLLLAAWQTHRLGRRADPCAALAG